MKFKAKNKLMALAIIPLLLITLLTTLAYYVNGTRGVEAQVIEFRQDLMAERQEELKSYIQLAQTAIRDLHKLNPTEANKTTAKALLRAMRFQRDGYFFVYDSAGVNIVHPVKPELEGKNLYSAQDKNGVRFIAGIIDAAKSGDGFQRYDYFKPSVNGLAPKLAYSEYVPTWDWVIGTGVYIDDIERRLSEYAAKRQAELLSDTWVSMMISLCILIVTIIGLNYAISRGVKPINNMLEKLNDIANGDGDLTARLEVQGQDELAELAVAFNQFMNKLQPLVKDISASATLVQEKASELNQQTQDSNHTIQEHSLETEKVVTAVTEMAATSREVANNTVSTASAIDSANQQLKEAQDEVDHAISGINQLVSEINTTSEAIESLSIQTDKITNVLEVIGSIAEQTNLLALNAAIEAARAGEQGRGFAVVADEVRSLASRTQSSTEEINQMIGDLHAGVKLAVSTMTNSQQRGEQTVSESASIQDKLSGINHAVATIQNMGHQTASAAEEQSVAAEEINQNLVSIQDIVTSLGKDLEHSAQIAAFLSHSGVELSSQMAQFKV